MQLGHCRSRPLSNRLMNVWFFKFSVLSENSIDKLCNCRHTSLKVWFDRTELCITAPTQQLYRHRQQQQQQQPQQPRQQQQREQQQHHQQQQQQHHQHQQHQYLNFGPPIIFLQRRHQQWRHRLLNPLICQRVSEFHNYSYAGTGGRGCNFWFETRQELLFVIRKYGDFFSKTLCSNTFTWATTTHRHRIFEILNEVFSHWEYQWEFQWGLAQDLDFRWSSGWCSWFWRGSWRGSWFSMRFLSKSSWFWNNLIEILMKKIFFS